MCARSRVKNHKPHVANELKQIKRTRAYFENAIIVSPCHVRSCKFIRCSAFVLLQWFPGTIAAVNEDFSYDIAYDDGETETNVSLSRIEVMPVLGG